MVHKNTWGEFTKHLKLWQKNAAFTGTMDEYTQTEHLPIDAPFVGCHRWGLRFFGFLLAYL